MLNVFTLASGRLIQHEIDSPSALEADPMLIKRLRRLRASRQRQRSARRLGMNP